jgi:hypothetical protein
MPNGFQQLATCIRQATLDGTNRGTHRHVSLYISNSSSDIIIINSNSSNTTETAATTTVAATAATIAK